MKKRLRLVVSALVAVAAGFMAAHLMPTPLPELSRQELLSEVRAEHVHKIVIHDHGVITGESTTRGPFRSEYKEPDDSALVTELRALGVEVDFEESGPGLI